MKLLRTVAAGTMLRMQIYLEKTGKKEYMEAYPELMEAMEELDEEGLVLWEREEQREESPYSCAIRFLEDGRADRRQVAQTLLDFAIAVFFFPQFGAVIEDFNGHVVTLELAYFMENIALPSFQDMRGLYERAAALMTSSGEGLPFFHRSFYADDRLIGYLCGEERVDERLTGIAELFLPEDTLPPLITAKELCARLTAALRYERESIIMKGEKGTGRKFLLCHALQSMAKSLLIVETEAVLKRKKDIDGLVRLIVREAFFHSCAVCLHGITEQSIKKAEMTIDEFVLRVAEPCLKDQIPVYFCTDEKTELMPHLYVPANQFQCRTLSRTERIQLWEGYAKLYGIQLDAVQLGSKYKFTPEEINKACMQLKARGEKEKLGEMQIFETLSRILPPVMTKGTIEPFHPNCTLEDLVLPEEMKDRIREICSHIWHSHKVYDEWNLESKYAYGKAVSVLLSGPPGTGKTMTARVISDLLKLPLYHVNLSQIVDKYIGETEKHLEEIFSNAERSNIILFFDEADAVFGKRSEVTDAKDRYANTEVSYILQRIEAYDGIVLLATNYKGNIDAAFMRRIQYILNFHLPDEEERFMLWRKCFPRESPLENIDFEYLAKQFEFSGSNIKNSALTAAFLAAGEGSAIGMKHVLGGIKNEYKKNGKPVLSADFGKYAYLY